jgi:hypothetical protein
MPRPSDLTAEELPEIVEIPPTPTDQLLTPANQVRRPIPSAVRVSSDRPFNVVSRLLTFSDSTNEVTDSEEAEEADHCFCGCELDFNQEDRFIWSCLDCKQKAHLNCIVKMFRKDKNNCPFCRKEILLDDVLSQNSFSPSYFRQLTSLVKESVSDFRFCREENKSLTDEITLLTEEKMDVDDDLATKTLELEKLKRNFGNFKVKFNNWKRKMNELTFSNSSSDEDYIPPSSRVRVS